MPAQISALPANDPVRKALEPRLAQLDAVIARGEQYLPVVDGAIASAQSGQIDPSLTAAAGAVPYGSLVLAAVGLVWGTIKHIQASATLEQHGKHNRRSSRLSGHWTRQFPSPPRLRRPRLPARWTPT